jgi:CHRD domain
MHIKTLALLAVSAASLLAGCATLEEGAAEVIADTKRATLSGSSIVGGAGDPDGYAKAELTISDQLNQLCYDVNDVRGLGTVTNVTIHRGAPRRNGPVVLRLNQANEGGWKNCVKRAEWLEDAIDNGGNRYYIQIATSEFPNGAIRGQFSRD